jgi:L-iditol 2-dehydrogenase
MGSYSASVELNAAVAELVYAGYRDGSFDLTRLVSHRFPVEDAVEAIHLASNPQPDSMKIMIRP